MNETLQHIATMTDRELDALTLGVIRVDRSGTIEYDNPAEAQHAHRTSARTVGLNYFRDVAPCTAVKEFQGRFDAFVAADLKESAPFAFTFPFGWGRRRVTIVIVRSAADDQSFYIVNSIEPVD